ncbi:MAG: trypsin-like peptidase domain-containing protein [Spirochaetia bacterium]|nr:trypsin-like peptidase domain-containing protein [Spirochaetia bacterium]
MFFRNIKISRFTLINIILFSVLIGTFLSPLVYGGLRDSFYSKDSPSAGPLSEKDQLAGLAVQKSYINVFKKASPSVVYIKTNVLVRPDFFFDFYRQVEGAGSGFIIDKEGHIITNSHVVAGAQKIEVHLNDDTRLKAKLIGRDENSDIALIKVISPPELSPAVLGDSDSVEPGQLAFALGAPYGLDSTFTVGIISAKHRFIDNSRYSRIQTDASINPGNSGGPLLNIYGEVIGINQSIISPGGQGGSVGIGFAIPINEVKQLIDQLKKEKRVIGRPAIGVQIKVPSPMNRDFLRIGDEPGLIVSFVIPGSAAEDAGLKEYDFITKANGKTMESPKDLVDEVNKTGVGGKVDLEIIRNGKKIKLKITVGEDTGGMRK